MKKAVEVKLNKIIDKMNLTNHLPEIDTEEIVVRNFDMNRPALQLAGFFDHFSSERVQIIGNVEYAYTQSLNREQKLKVYGEIFARKIPCIIYARNLQPDEDVKALAVQYGIPLLGTEKNTSDLMAELIRWMKIELAPCISIHGVLVDVFGEGVLIQGESGIGKSEAALELIKRGHRLVTDDVVEIRKVSDVTLVGSAPNITRHMLELRGIGILDVKTLFGVESVKNTQQIDIVINLEDWNREKEYDRLGLDDNYTEILGNKVLCQTIPIRPGRNLAIIVEAAAVNYRQKKMGYNAARELYDRVQKNLMGEYKVPDESDLFY